MRNFQTWARAIALFLAFGGAAQADTSLSLSNDPAAAVDTRLARLLGQEQSALSAIGRAHLEKIATPQSTSGSAAQVTIKYDPAWIDSRPEARGGEEWACFAKALYFEARGESVKGEFAVGEVILNRVRSGKFPDTVCGVVNQGTGRRNACQFSFTCDGRSDAIRNPDAYVRAGKIARLLLDGAHSAVTAGATYFHTIHVNPSWSAKFTRTASIGAHLFFRPATRVASN